MPRNKSLFQNRDFTILWSGQTISILGSTISQIAFPLLILELSKSPLQAGIGSALITLPTLLFGLIAGVLVDRLNRKHVMIICDVGRMFVMLSVPIAAFLGYLSVIQLYIAAFCEGTLSIFFAVAQIAATAHIVPKNQMAEAVSQSEIGASTASLIGPSIGGFIYQTVGKTIPYLFDSLSYLISVISLLFIKGDFQKNDKKVHEHIHLEMRKGLVWIWRHKTIRLLTLLTAGGALAGTAQNIFIILLAQRIGASPAIIGVIFSIASVGGIIGALFARAVAKNLDLRKTIVWGRWLIASTYALLFFAVNPLLMGIIVGLYYAIGPVYGTVLAAYRITLIPHDLQGRVNSVFRIVLYAGLTGGSVIGGYLAQKIGVYLSLSMMCVFLGILAAIATLNKDLRESS